MIVGFKVLDGKREQNNEYYRQNSIWYPKYKPYKGSHSSFAEMLEAKYHPIAKFFEDLDNGYIVRNNQYTASLNTNHTFSKMFLHNFAVADNANEFKEYIQNEVKAFWIYWLVNNIGRIKTGVPANPNPNYTPDKLPGQSSKVPLVDTGQYAKSLSFELTYIGQDRLNFNMAFKYTSKQEREYMVEQWEQEPFKSEVDYRGINIESRLSFKPS